MRRFAFTMIELVFVIVIMGIIGKFGVEFIMSAYKGYIDTSVYNRMQSHSEAAVTQIGARLQYRIRDSVIARPTADFGAGGAYHSVIFTTPSDTVLEWVGYDIDGWRGTWNTTDETNWPNWSGFIDLNDPTANANMMISPRTDASNIGRTINALSYGDPNIDENDLAIFFHGASTFIEQYGWDGGVNNQNDVPHPVNINNNELRPNGGDFSGVTIYERYYLAWSAYAIEHNQSDNTLWLHYNYRPWNNDYNNRHSSLLMENVDQFRFSAEGEMLWIQVCTKDSNYKNTPDGNYSICKEKTIL